MSDFNFEGMGDLKKRTGRSGGSFSFNLPFRINQVNVANDKAATPSVDTVEGYLMAPAFGLNTNDLVTFKIKDRAPPKDPKKVPMEIWDLQIGKKKGSGGRMGQHAAVVAEDARMLSDGTVECGWIRVAEHAYNEKPEKEFLHIGPISVGYLNVGEKPGDFTRQDRYVHFPQESRLVSGDGDAAIASFKEVVSSLLADRTEQAGGRPTVVVRLVNQKKVGEVGSVATASVRLGWDKQNGTFMTPEETVDRWLADEENAKWVNFIGNADKIAKSEGVLEVWPAWLFQSGKMLSDREVEMKTKGYMHTSEQFSAPMIDEAGEPILNDNGNRRTHYGLIADGLHQVVQLENRTDWIANSSWTFERYPSKLYSIDDLPTKHLAAETVKAFEAVAVKRTEEKKNDRTARREPAAGQSQDQDQGQDFGSDAAPDATGGQFRPR